MTNAVRVSHPKAWWSDDGLDQVRKP
jgi:hypothetical protein